MPVSFLISNFYGCWREQTNTFALVREGESIPPERLLQAVWHHQRLRRAHLQTLDGRTVRVLHPGFWNKEAGPDFRDAVVQIGGELKTGDVEIDLQPSGWRSHAHDRNPNYKNVILHVLWEGGEGKSDLPVLAMKPFLDAPLPELAMWVGGEAAKSWPEELAGNCCAPLRDLPEEKLRALLQEASHIRLQRKAYELQSRAREAGWELALWEGLFKALGYKHNIWPMQRVAELLPQITADNRTTFGLQARLLGISGLLPDEDPGPESGSDNYFRKIWDRWWRERESFADVLLPKSLWCFSGLRPANHPQRRLALAAHWLAEKDFLPRLEQWFVSEQSEKTAPFELEKILHVAGDDYWCWHWTFRSARMDKPQPLIGEKRVTDLAINVILPWFWMRAVAGKNAKLRNLAEARYFAWPLAEDNSVLKLARQRLLGENKPKLFRTSALQQGLLQVVRDFCEHSNAVCDNCQFPDLVRKFRNEQNK